MMKIFKETCELRDEILEALFSGEFMRATALMININYLILLLRRRGVIVDTRPEVFFENSRKTLRALEKLELLTSDILFAIEVKEYYYLENGIQIDCLLDEDLNSYGRAGKSIMFSVFESEKISEWLLSLYEEEVQDGMDIFFNELQRNIDNEIFQYKLYMLEDSDLRDFFIGRDNSNLSLTRYKNEKSQSLLHLASIKKDYETIEDSLVYLNLDPLEEDVDGYTAIELIGNENADKIINTIFMKGLDSTYQFNF